MSHTTATYEQQQQNWALHVDYEQPIVVEKAAPVPVAADLVPVAATVSVANDLVVFVAVALASVSGQKLHVVLPDNERQIVCGHAYYLQDNWRHRYRSPRVEGHGRNGRFIIFEAFYAELENEEVEPHQENKSLECPAITFSAEYALRGGCERVEEFIRYAELTSLCYKTDLKNSESAVPKGSHRIYQY
ncbi:unnamed protein product [Macrosiphum euphorbiae]|uniref:Uncharacterized protein n=1 Tax=Macrosiphum euphorbiae TaxID=13131 RepID=A0AAV0WTX4_9HEMI|nr:unnamed protein product [Macrosiphum euphorbiae]